MARKQITLSFYDKTYTIEFDRASVKEFLKVQDVGDDVDKVVALIKSGLVKHHKNELPTDEQIFGWVMAMGNDINEFAEALHGMVQDVLLALEQDRKNLKWAKVEA